jgi:hypothetical protein
MTTIMIKKAGREITIPAFPAHIQNHIYEYGLKQKLNDAISGLSLNGSDSTTKATPEEMFAVVQALVDRLMAGDIRAATRTRKVIDTLEKECMKIASTRVLKRWQKANPNVPVSKYETRHADALADLEAHRDAIEPVAQATLDLLNEGNEVDDE